MKALFPAFDEALFITLLEQLARAPGLPGREGERQAVLASFLSGKGVEATSDAAGNLWVNAGTGKWAESVVFEAHVDTVSPGRAESVERKNGRLVAAGLSDNLAQVALLALFAVARKRDPGPTGRPLRLLFSVGEEGLGNLRGVRQMIADHPQAPYAFIAWEAGPGTVSLDAVGSRRYRLTVTGPGGHSWNEFGNPGAISDAVGLASRIEADYRRAAGNLPGNLSFNIGTFRGGEGINCIARRASLALEFRSTEPRALEAADKILRKRMDGKAAPGIKRKLRSIGERPASGPKAPAPVVRAIRRAWKAEGIGLKRTTRSTSINVPLAAGWPCACLGLCVGGRGHNPDSWIELASLPTAWRLLHRLEKTLSE